MFSSRVVGTAGADALGGVRADAARRERAAGQRRGLALPPQRQRHHQRHPRGAMRPVLFLSSLPV
eukprot:3493774-Rhodomonas_salina.1